MRRTMVFSVTHLAGRVSEKISFKKIHAKARRTATNHPFALAVPRAAPAVVRATASSRGRIGGLDARGRGSRAVGRRALTPPVAPRRAERLLCCFFLFAGGRRGRPRFPAGDNRYLPRSTSTKRARGGESCVARAGGARESGARARRATTTSGPGSRTRRDECVLVFDVRKNPPPPRRRATTTDTSLASSG